MATKNIVPRTGSEGEIGTSSKSWSKAHIDEVTASIGVSASYFYGDGSNLTGIATGTPTLDEVTTAGNTTANNITIGQVSASYLSASSDIRVAGNSHFGSELTDTHIFTGSFHQTGSGATSTFKDRIITTGSMAVHGLAGTSEVFRAEGSGDFHVHTDGNITFNSEGNDINFYGGSPKINSGNFEVEGQISGTTFIGDGSGLTGVTGDWDGQHTGDAGITGSLEIQSASGIEVKRSDGTTLGNIEQYGPTGFKISSVAPLQLSGTTGVYINSAADIELNPASSGKVEVDGAMSASLGITASSFVGDGSGLTNLPAASWDGQLNGDAGITGSLEVQGGDGIVIKGEDGSISGSISPLQAYYGSLKISTPLNTDLTLEAGGNGYTILKNGYSHALYLQALKASIATPKIEIEGAGSTSDDQYLFTGYPSTHYSKAKYFSIGQSDSHDAMAITAGKSGTGDNEMAFFTSNSSSAEAERMRIDVSGNIGIGTATPTHKLDVVGSISASLGITGSEIHTDTAHITNLNVSVIKEPAGNVEGSLAPGIVNIFNDLAVGINADPDVLAVDRSEGKVGVNYNIADLPAANFSVSGSTKLGELSTDTHQFTGSFLLRNPDETNAGLSIEAGSTNHVTIKTTDATNGRINIGSGLNSTLLIQSKFAGSAYPFSGTSYEWGNASSPWGLIGTKQLSASIGAHFANTTAPGTPTAAAQLYAKSGALYTKNDDGIESLIEQRLIAMSKVETVDDTAVACDIKLFSATTSGEMEALQWTIDGATRYAKVTFTAPANGQAKICMSTFLKDAGGTSEVFFGLHNSSTSTTTPTYGWFQISKDSEAGEHDLESVDWVLTGLTAGASITVYVHAVCTLAGSQVKVGRPSPNAWSNNDLPKPTTISVYTVPVTIDVNPT